MSKLIISFITVFSLYITYIITESYREYKPILSKSSRESKMKEIERLSIKGYNEPDEAIAELISKYSRKHSLERSVLSCVLKIESEYTLKAISATEDYGIGQINKRAWPEFDSARLVTELEYSINASAKVLSYYKWLRSKDEPTNWICRYNVGPGPLNGELGPKAATRAINCVNYMERFNSCYTSNPFIGL